MKKIPVYGIKEFSEGDAASYFYSNDLASHLKSHQFINSPHKHSTYISILFTKGTGEHQIDFDTFTVRQGSVFLMNPGQIHCWKLSSDARGYVFFHTKEFYNSVFLKREIEDFPFFYLQQNNPLVQVAVKDISKVEALFKEINDEFKSSNLHKLNKLENLVDLVYIELSRLYNKKVDGSIRTDTNYFKVKKLQKLIDENFKEQKFPKEYANKMNMSTRHLSRICNDTLNKSTTELIAERIVLEAKRLLIHNDATIAEVADELGYDDHSYFVRLFKKNTGVTPKEFQKKILS